MRLLSGTSRIVRVGSHVRPPSLERANSVSPEKGEVGLVMSWICNRSHTAYTKRGFVRSAVIDSLSLNRFGEVSRWSVVILPQLRPPSVERETRMPLTAKFGAGPDTV